MAAPSGARARARGRNRQIVTTQAGSGPRAGL